MNAFLLRNKTYQGVRLYQLVDSVFENDYLPSFRTNPDVEPTFHIEHATSGQSIPIDGRPQVSVSRIRNSLARPMRVP